MLSFIKNWIDRYWSDEAAIALAFVLLISVIIVFTIGDILAPVLAGIIFAYILQGIVNHLQKNLRCPHMLAVSITFLLFMAVLIWLIFMIFPLVWNQVFNLFNELPKMVIKFQSILKELPQKYPAFISEELVRESVSTLSSQLGKAGQSIVSFSLSKIVGVVSILIYLILVPLLVFFFLKDKDLIMSAFRKIIPSNQRLISQVAVEMNQQIANYMRGKVIEIIVVTIADYILFAALGLDYAILLAVLVGLSVIIPYIGAIVVTIPVVIIAFLQWGFGSDFILLMSLYAVIQGVDGNILVPLLFGEALNLHPVAIITSILFFGGLWGFWGVFFAIPLATLIKAIYNAWPNTKNKKIENVKVT